MDKGKSRGKPEPAKPVHSKVKARTIRKRELIGLSDRFNCFIVFRVKIANGNRNRLTPTTPVFNSKKRKPIFGENETAKYFV